MGDADDIARRRRAERERLRREGAREKREMEENEQRVADAADSSFVSDIESILGINPAEVSGMADYAEDNKGRREIKEFADTYRAYRNNWIFKPSRSTVRRKAKAAKGAVRKAKAKKGCSLWALVILAAVGSAFGGGGWAVFELVHSVV